MRTLGEVAHALGPPHLFVAEAPQQLQQHVLPLCGNGRAAALPKHAPQQPHRLEPPADIRRAQLVRQQRHHRQQCLGRDLLKLRRERRRGRGEVARLGLQVPRCEQTVCRESQILVGPSGAPLAAQLRVLQAVRPPTCATIA